MSKTNFPTFGGEPTADPLAGEEVKGFVNDIIRGSERLVQKVSADVNEISIRRAMQIGYMLACQEHGLDVPEMTDPAEAMGYKVG